MASAGLTDKEISHRLGLSIGTIRTYWDRLRQRHGVESRSQLIACLCRAEIDSITNERDVLLRILNALPEFLWTSHQSGYVDFVSDRMVSYSGLARKELIGQGCRAIMPFDELPDSTARWQHAISTNEPYEADVRLRCGEDGSLRWHRIRLAPLCGDFGGRWLGIAKAIPALAA